MKKLTTVAMTAVLLVAMPALAREKWGVTMQDTTSVEGKEVLRNEIIRRLNSFLDQGKVAEVYFTDFVVQ